MPLLRLLEPLHRHPPACMRVARSDNSHPAVYILHHSSVSPTDQPSSPMIFLRKSPLLTQGQHLPSSAPSPTYFLSCSVLHSSTSLLRIPQPLHPVSLPPPSRSLPLYSRSPRPSSCLYHS